MKQLISRCSGLRIYKNKFTAIAYVSLTLLGLSQGLSCFRETYIPLPDRQNQANAPDTLTLEVAGSLDRSLNVGSIPESSCQQQSARAIDFTLSTAVGDFTATISPLNEGSSLVSINHQQFRLALPFPLNPALNASCGDRKTYQLTANELKAVQAFLSDLAPGCRDIQPTGNLHWRCSEELANPSLVVQRTKQLHTRIMSHVRRQSYSLMRKIALTKHLAEALSHRDNEELDRYCAILSYAMPFEAPIALASPDWQKRVCQSPSAAKQPQQNTVTNGIPEGRRIAARLGLRYALAEVEALVDLLDDSRRGVIRLKIPANQPPTKELKVTLTPGSLPPPSPTLEPSTAGLPPGSQEPQDANGCWHPLLTYSAIVHKLAQNMNLLPPACRPTFLNPLENHLAETYLFSAIASETEFTVSNGYSKIIRLPQGDYSYTIETADERDPSADEAPKPVSTGTLSWSQRRNQHTIRRW